MAGVAKKTKLSFASQETVTIEIEEGTDPITKENETNETVQVTRDIEEDIVIVQGTGGIEEAAGDHDERRRPLPFLPLTFAHLRSDASDADLEALEALARRILPTRDVDDDDNDSRPSTLPPAPAPAPTPAPAPVAPAPVGRPSVVINQYGNGIMQVSINIDSSGALSCHTVRR